MSKPLEGEIVKMGRPSKLTAEITSAAFAWLKDQKAHKTDLPTIEGLALELNISRETLYQWEKENKDFSDILENLRQIQANKLIQKGLINEYNPTIAKMILSGKHGYVEKSEVDQKIIMPQPILGGESVKELSE